MPNEPFRSRSTRETDLSRTAQSPQPSSIKPSIIAALGAALVIGLSALPQFAPKPLLLWNATPSSTVGLYLVGSSTRLKRGQVLVAYASEPAREIAAARRYLPHDVPLVKPVAGVPSDRVCASGSNIFINGRFAAKRLSRDPLGRPLPWWSGCRTLEPGDAFLLSAQVPLAFDGRYFGVTRKSEIVGTAILLWKR